MGLMLHAHRMRGQAWMFAALALASMCMDATAAATCDFNADNVVDRRDLDVLTAVLNTRVSGANDSRDVNRDGVLNALDARQCVLLCTRARCAYVSPPEVVSQVVGTTGGTLRLRDGSTLTIPSNALAAPINITVREVPLPAPSFLPRGSALAGPLLSLEPEGLVFLEPVLLTMPINAALLPPGYDRADALIATRLPSGRFSIVGSATDDPEPESHMQAIDTSAGNVSVLLKHFSHYGAIYAGSPGGFVREVVSVPGAPGSTLTIRRPPGPAPVFRQNKPVFNNCTDATGMRDTSEVPLVARTAASIQAILIHSTNGGPNHTFSGELGWGADNCNLFFAHYYIDRTGEIYQIVDDLSIVNHTIAGTYTNANSIGIELFNNIGEPYDGQQVQALIQLLDYLTLRYGIARPARNAGTGLLTRNAATDRIVTHSENYGPKCPATAARCDPIGNFQSSDTRTFIAAGVLDEEPIPQGSAAAPSLLDMVVDTLAVLDRGRNHTGIINTAGGDSIGQATGGAGGAVNVTDAMPVPSYPGADRANHDQLVVAAGTTMSLPLPLPAALAYSDMIVAGRLEINQDITLNISGSLYVAPTGSIVVRSLTDGGDLTIASRGPAIIQGLIDLRGDDAPATGANVVGGNGGNLNLLLNRDQLNLLPSVITRGGDTDVGLNGGNGGAVNVTLGSGHLFVGGGTGPRPTLTVTPKPPSRSDLQSVDPDFTANFGAADSIFPSHSGDKLPPPPPFNLGTIGYPRPVSGQRTPLQKSAAQAGFARGILTSGGMGGAGAAGFNAGAGGVGGAGGNVVIGAGNALSVTFRNVDLITGGDVESVVSSIFVDPNSGLQISYRAPSGSLGGKAPAVSGVANRGGDGGAGGAAGSILFQGLMTPLASQSVVLGRIIGFTNPATPLLAPNRNDNPLDLARFSIGSTVELRDAGNNPLYRLRLSDQGDAMGGSGGVPGGRSQQQNFPGNFGRLGPGGAISGLPR